MARRVRDPDLPLRHRTSAFRSLLTLHAPFGFQATERHLRKLVRRRGRHGWWRPVRSREWTETMLLDALDLLETSRDSHVRYAAVFAERRRNEKSHHRRQPTRADSEALRRAEWLKDAGEAACRQPSRRETRRSRG